MHSNSKKNLVPKNMFAAGIMAWTRGINVFRKAPRSLHHLLSIQVQEGVAEIRSQAWMPFIWILEMHRSQFCVKE